MEPWNLGTLGAHISLLALNAIVYAAVRHFEFVNWDDPSYILENVNVRRGLTWETARWAIVTGYSPYWHPVTWLSHLLDVRLFGLDAGAHHLINLLLHIANSSLIFELFRRATTSVWQSAFVAALFAVHPLHVESVAWVAERKDVLSTFFWALTILGYVAYVRRPHWGRYVAVLALFGLALMAKPMVVTLPFVLLLLDLWPLQRVSAVKLAGWGRVLIEKVPLLGLSIATSIATVIVQNRVGAMASLDALPPHLRLGHALVGYVVYLRKAVWPSQLAAFYPFRPASAAMVAAAAILLLAITLAAFRSRERHPYLLVGWLWFLVTLSPVIGLLQAGEQAIADRFMYVPIVGLFIVAAWGGPQLIRRLIGNTRAPLVLASAACAVIIAFGVTTQAQVQHWRDSVTLWRHGARVTPDSYIAFENLGQALRERGQLDEALVNYSRALALAPAGSPRYAAVIHNSAGLVQTRQGRVPDALQNFEAAVRLDPAFAEPRSNFANALAAEGRFEEAILQYQAAVRLKPEVVEARIGLGSALLSQGRSAEAIPHYQEALRRQPDIAEAHNGLGAALAMQGDDRRALEEYQSALRLKPDLSTAHFNLAVLFIKQNRIADARRHLQQAVASDPGYRAAQELLARLEAGNWELETY